jgi:tetratricopeptide (TPR) repeat protein
MKIKLKIKREKRKNKISLSLFPLLFSLFSSLLIIPSCSTPPKNPGDVYSLRKQAETHLELGGKDADRGSFETALLKLDEAMKLAIAVDDPSLRIRVGLSRGNVLFSLGRGEEMAEAWNNALGEAERIGNSELAAVSRIHIARGKLLLTERVEDMPAVAQSVRDEVNRNLAQIKDRYYTAFAWTIVGLAERELERFTQAEAAVRRALEIHEKDNYFELAAYDWFLIATFRSLSGNHRGALQALESAIAFDRRVENSWGLAGDWQGMGIVYRYMGNAEASRAAYLRAAEIFRAIGNDEAAAKVRSQAENGQNP